VLDVIKFRCAFNFLLLATLLVLEIFLSGYRRKDKDNEAGSSRETVCKSLTAENWIQNMSFDFINTDVDGEERPDY
jgi:hypothetical protein